MDVATVGEEGLAIFESIMIDAARKNMPCAGIVILLFLRLFSGLDRLHLGSVAFVVAITALAISFFQWSGQGTIDVTGQHRQIVEMFSGMLAFDNLTIYLRLFLFGFTSLIILLTVLTGIPDREDSADRRTAPLPADRRSLVRRRRGGQ